MIITASQVVHRIGGFKASPICSDVEPFVCWVCGGRSGRGAKRAAWQGAMFTGQNRVRCPASEFVCEACVVVMAGKPPDTERMWSHLVEGDSHQRCNKGHKPQIREFLRRQHAAPWFAAIADSGQKHIVPWCTVNPAGQSGGRILLEEAEIDLPRDAAGWALLDEIADLLTAGATKEEMGRGEYGPRAWSLCGAALRAFEEARGHLRGGAWFELAVWLAQRDEAAVEARMQAEKEAKQAKAKQAKEAERERSRKGKAAKPDRGGAPRTKKGVPRDAGVQHTEALGSAPGQDARGGAVDGDSGGVGHHDGANATTGRKPVGQLSLL